MRFGIREVCHCHFVPYDANNARTPEFVIDTAKMSTIEGASTTVYAQGGSGNARLMAWEGEKTLTFTVEDALITKESFQALTGAERTGNTFKVKSTSFAGQYKVTAYTLFRDEDNNDYLATIVIPRAKLQTQLNLQMAPTGDPSTFTFTFDALPDLTDEGTMFTLTIDDSQAFTGDLASQTPEVAETTVVYINSIEYTTTADAPKLNVTKGTTSMSLTLTGSTTSISTTLESGEILTNFQEDYVHSTTEDYEIALVKGSSSRWYTMKI